MDLDRSLHLMQDPLMSPNGIDASGQNALKQINPRLMRTASNNATAAHDVYVGQIPMEVDTQYLYAFFAQFGEIERIYDGRKSSTGELKWAFVSYFRAEDANKYSAFRIELIIASCNKLVELDLQDQFCYTYLCYRSDK
jgi:RNA recognition motif